MNIFFEQFTTLSKLHPTSKLEVAVNCCFASTSCMSYVVVLPDPFRGSPMQGNLVTVFHVNVQLFLLKANYIPIIFTY